MVNGDFIAAESGSGFLTAGAQAESTSMNVTTLIAFKDVMSNPPVEQCLYEYRNRWFPILHFRTEPMKFDFCREKTFLPIYGHPG
jgi:hypothetical protein